jgi:hypothetical protein
VLKTESLYQDVVALQDTLMIMYLPSVHLVDIDVSLVLTMKTTVTNVNLVDNKLHLVSVH